MGKRIGVIPHLYAQPLFHGLKKRTDSMFELVENSSAQLALQLRQSNLDGAFLSPIDYAKDYRLYQIIPNLCVASEGESGAIDIVFNEGTRTLKTLAIDPGSTSEIVLARIILAEKFDIVPQFIPFSGSPQQALAKADGVLVYGDTANAFSRHTNKLDLVDEWMDIAEMPFVHGIWAEREEALTSLEVTALRESRDDGITMIGEIVSGNELSLSDRFTYDLDDRAIASLTEFFRMAYYHGILKDIPDLKFHRQEGKQPSSAISLKKN